MEMEQALKKRNTARWAKDVSKMLNLAQVIDEIKTSMETKKTCLACKFGVNLIRYMVENGKSDQEIAAVGSQMCITLQLQTPRVCSGIMDLIGVSMFFSDIIIYYSKGHFNSARKLLLIFPSIRFNLYKSLSKLNIFLCRRFSTKNDVCKISSQELFGLQIDVIKVIRSSEMTPAQICSFFSRDACSDGYDERHDWRVMFPEGKKTGNHITEPPPENVPRLKVLQISDTHFDPYYEVGTNADCGEPLCCRATDGPPKTSSAAAGKWGDYRKCDTPRHLLDNALKHIVDTHKVQ